MSARSRIFKEAAIIAAALHWMPLTTLVTLALDPVSQRRFESLRQQHYPAALNRIPAHLSLFHKLPGTEAVGTALWEGANGTPEFPLEVTSARSLGRGVAYALAAKEVLRLHAELARRFEPDLTPQDRQRFQPHIVVQNKVSPAEAKALLALLQAAFVPGQVRAVGLLWWEYLGGPWRLLEEFPFRPRVPE